ncbi:MAG: phosphatidylglycerophosphatase A [Elusimicrobiota bacterium]|jgi:phosphatidylglycerophosphatase A|nr:phosphatidylglycerophosphatase A [Elusimicrobiota bacterium]
MYTKFCYIIASFCGIGYIPFASGSFASFITLPIAFVITYFWGFFGIFFSSIIIFFIGNFASKEVLKYTNHDPSFIVIDEVLGQLITFIFCSKYLKANLKLDIFFIYMIGFLLFRIFDIFKHGLVNWADKKIENSWGVMLDDVFAGLQAGLVLLLIILLIEVFKR